MKTFIYNSNDCEHKYDAIFEKADLVRINHVLYQLIKHESAKAGYMHVVDCENDYAGSVDIIGCLIYDGVEYYCREIGLQAFKGCQVKYVEIPDTVNTIKAEAFMNCGALKLVNIPYSVTEIGSGAFSGCVDLHTICLPDSVEELGYDVFMKSGLRTITWPKSLTCIPHGTFEYCNRLVSINLPDYLECIDDFAFAGCTSLRHVNFFTEEERLVIFSDAFSDCRRLESTNLIETAHIISTGAFSGCTSLKEVNLNPCIEELGDRAFLGCTSLTKVCGPKDIIENDPTIFEECTSLTDLQLFERE